MSLVKLVPDYGSSDSEEEEDGNTDDSDVEEPEGNYDNSKKL